MSQLQTKNILGTKFAAIHVDSILKNFDAAIEKFIAEEWDGVALKAGKFVEATTKALIIYCGKTLPTSARKFKAGVELKDLEKLDSSKHSETVRIVVPKACLFVYEVVNNRGGRHDASDIDANQMDAKAIVPIMSWILAEMVRYAGAVKDPVKAMSLIDELSNKIYPFFEEIDGRTYVNLKDATATDISLLILYAAYPKRINRRDLVDAVKRHGAKNSAAETAVHRSALFVDDDAGEWKLRGSGRQKAEELISKFRNRQ